MVLVSPYLSASSSSSEADVDILVPYRYNGLTSVSRTGI